MSCEKFCSDKTIELQRELLPGSREKRTRLVICVIAGGSFFRPTALQQGNQAFGVSDLAALCLQVLYLGTQVHISDVILATGNLAWNALTIEERFDLFRSARTSCTTFNWSVPSRPVRVQEKSGSHIQAYVPYES